MTEGNSGSINATLTVTLSYASDQPVTVAYATQDNTATAGKDYTAKSGVLTFAPGVTKQTIAVPVLGDKLDENDEAFFVNLSNATNAGIPDGVGLVTIIDNDPLPALSIKSAKVTEPNPPNLVNAVFAGQPLQSQRPRSHGRLRNVRRNRYR